MEWNPILNNFVQVENLEEENYLINLNQEIDDYLRYERNYEDYLNYLEEPIDIDTHLHYINNLIKQFEMDNNLITIKYKKWHEVPNYVKNKILKIFEIKINNNEINLENFKNDKIYYSYLLKLTNIAYSLTEDIFPDDNSIFVTLTLS